MKLLNSVIENLRKLLFFRNEYQQLQFIRITEKFDVVQTPMKNWTPIAIKSRKY
jgi:hypothetical protein